MANFMKKLAFATLVFTASIASASAADLAARPYTKAPAPVVAALYDWSGFYVGVNVGGGWGNRSVDYMPNDAVARITNGTDPFPFAIPGTSFKSSGVLGGVQAGYNYQVNANWLVGIEADLDGTNINGKGQSASQRGVAITLNLPVEEKIKWFGTVRGRLGVLPAPNLLAYITGGFAYGQVDHSGSSINTSVGALANSGGGVSAVCFTGQNCYAGSASNLATGWTAGGGLEYALGSNWTIKGEYLFVSLAGKSMTESALLTVPGFPTPSSFNANFSQTNFHVARIGVNYRFGGPVVAKY